MPAYTELDSNAPDGTTGTGTSYSAADLANMRALRDMVITGRVKGWLQSRTQGSGPDVARPQFITWLNATLSIGFRLNMTWSGFTCTSITWEWSAAADYSSVWTAMGSAQANTYDGSNNITATTNSGGFFTILLEIWTKCIKVVSDFATHIAGTGTAVHGLGTMSTQNANAIAVVDGTMKGVVIGGTAAGEFELATFAAAREKFNDYGTISSGATCTVEMDKYGVVAITAPASGSWTLDFNGKPASGFAQGILIEATNWGAVTPTLPTGKKWAGGTQPTFTASGTDLLRVYTRDNGSTWRWALADKDSR